VARREPAAREPPASHDGRRRGFTVASGGDGVDVAPGNGACADAGGACTLRAAIMEANALPGTDAIAVTATGTITLGSALPALAHDVSITGPSAGVLTIDAGAARQRPRRDRRRTATVADLSLTGGNGGPSNTGGGSPQLRSPRP
jgi:CSLREA domain-containing protein